MENAPAVPNIAVKGYHVARTAADMRWLGEEQARRRTFQFGCLHAALFRIQFHAFDAQDREPTCLASEGRAGRISRTSKGGKQKASYNPRRDWGRFCELQGLPATFLEDAPFTSEGKYRVVGNGVPLPMGRAVARAVKFALAQETAAA